jgi:hypothetical protein
MRTHLRSALRTVTSNEGMKDREQLIKVWSTFSAAD